MSDTAIYRKLRAHNLIAQYSSPLNFLPFLSRDAMVFVRGETLSAHGARPWKMPGRIVLVREKFSCKMRVCCTNGDIVLLLRYRLFSIFPLFTCKPNDVGAVAPWLVRSSPDRAVRVRALAGDIVLCSWARHLTLTVPLSTQVYKWVTPGGSRNTPSRFMLPGETPA